MSFDTDNPEDIKARMRAALDVLKNFVDKDGRLNATKLTTELREANKRVAELEREIARLQMEREWYRAFYLAHVSEPHGVA